MRRTLTGYAGASRGTLVESAATKKHAFFALDVNSAMGRSCAGFAAAHERVIGRIAASIRSGSA
jgi:hypothetical protein